METTLDVIGQLFFQVLMVVLLNVTIKELTMLKSVRQIVENLLKDGTFFLTFLCSKIKSFELGLFQNGNLFLFLSGTMFLVLS